MRKEVEELVAILKDMHDIEVECDSCENCLETKNLMRKAITLSSFIISELISPGITKELGIGKQVNKSDPMTEFKINQKPNKTILN